MSGHEFGAAEKEALARLAANVRYWRLQAHLTQQELAEAVRIQAASLQDLEAGRSRPSLTLLVRLSVVLDVALTELLVERDLPKRRSGRPRKSDG